MLTLAYNGDNTQWVAVQGSQSDDQGSFDKDVWFGRVESYSNGSHGRGEGEEGQAGEEREEGEEGEEGEKGEEGEAMLQVIWLKKSTRKKAGTNRYELCTSTPEAWIPIDSVILFGVNFRLHFIWQTRKTVLELKTPMRLIKKIWISKNKQETFSQLVLSLSDDDDYEGNAIYQVVRKRKVVSSKIWKSEEEIATSIFNSIINK